MNPNIRIIMALFEELSPDERLHVADLISDEYDIFLSVESPPQSKGINGNKLTILVKQGAINSHYLSVDRHYDFFPNDAVGTTNEPAAKNITLLVHAYPKTLETDVLRDKGRFRIRAWQEFYRDNKIKEGSYVIIERISDYKYRVYPIGLS